MNRRCVLIRQAYAEKMMKVRELMSNILEQTSLKTREIVDASKARAIVIGERMNEIYSTHAHPRVMRMTEYMNGIYSSRVAPVMQSENFRRVMSIASSEYVTPVAEFYQGALTRYHQALIKMQDLWKRIEKTEQYSQIKELALTWLEHVSGIELSSYIP